MFDALQPSTRDKLARYIAENPGAHHRRLARAMDVAGATTHYHLRALVAAGRVVAERDGRYVRYYAAGTSAESRRAAALLAREGPRRVLLALLAGPPGTCQEIAARARLKAPATAATLRRLVAAGAVRREWSRGAFCYLLAPEFAQVLRSQFPATTPGPETVRAQ